MSCCYGYLMPMLTGRNHHRPIFLRSTDAASLEKVSAGTKTRNTKLLSMCRASASRNPYSRTNKHPSMLHQQALCCEQLVLKGRVRTYVNKATL